MNNLVKVVLAFLIISVISCFLSTYVFAAGRKHEEYVIKDNRGVRIGRIVTDHVRGGYKIQNNYGVTKSRIKAGRLPDKFTIERKRR